MMGGDLEVDADIIQIDNYINDFFKNKTPQQIKYFCSKIINFEPVKNLDKYDKEVLALNIEKRIILAIEKSCQTIHKPSYWKHFKIEAPFVYDRDNILNDYLDLFVRNMYSTYPNKEVYKDINSFYNTKTLIASKSFKNRLISLPSGERISINDIINSFSNLIENNTIVKTEYEIKGKVGELKKIAAMTGILTVVGTSVVLSQKTTENDKQIKIEYENHKDYNASKQEETSETVVNNFENENVLDPIFIGYENACPKEYQRYMLEMSEKYDVPFNILMTIADNESNGLFDNNGKISDWDDYGFFQINICNHDLIFKNLGYEPSDLLNNPFNNIQSATYLIKNICNMFEEDLKNNNYENIFGTYNGWVNWQSKDTSKEYVIKATEKINTIYNKPNEELFIKVNEDKNGRTK